MCTDPFITSLGRLFRWRNCSTRQLFHFLCFFDLHALTFTSSPKFLHPSSMEDSPGPRASPATKVPSACQRCRRQKLKVRYPSKPGTSDLSAHTWSVRHPTALYPLHPRRGPLSSRFGDPLATLPASARYARITNGPDTKYKCPETPCEFTPCHRF